MDWCLYDKGLRHERVDKYFKTFNILHCAFDEAYLAIRD